MSRAARSAGRAASLTGRGDLGASLVLIFPLLLIYEIGVLFAGQVNGADLVTRAVFAAAGSRTAYLAIYAAIAAGFLIWIRRTRRRSRGRSASSHRAVLFAALSPVVALRSSVW